MKKIVPDPPILRVRPGLSTEEALVHASDHLTCALAISQEAIEKAQPDGMTLVRSAVHQIEVARALVEVSLATLPRPAC